MKVVLFILLLIVVLIAVVLIRTLTLKETSAKTAKIELDTSARADEYAQTLAKMIRKETISDRYNDDRTKFYEFHELFVKL
jgi:carboxypeptidase PM20D1